MALQQLECFQATLEAIVVKGFNALAGILMALEVHKGITHIRHGALVQGAVEEVKGTGKAQVLQLRDQLPLGVAIRDVADPGHVEPRGIMEQDL